MNKTAMDVYNQQMNDWMIPCIVVATSCFVLVRFQLGGCFEHFLASVGIFATTILVLISSLTKEYKSSLLEFQVLSASLVLVSPYLWKAFNGTLPMVRNINVEDHFRHGWKLVATTLFTALGGEKLVSVTGISLVKNCAGLAFVFLLQGYFVDPNGRYAKIWVFAGCFLQLPIFMGLLYGNLYPKEDFRFSIYLVSAIIAGVVVLIKLGVTIEGVLNFFRSVFRFVSAVRQRRNSMPRRVAV